MKKAEWRGQIMVILSRHVGEEKAIGMAELFSQVTGRPWKNRINDTRILRELVTELRHEGALIGDSQSCNGGGYYLARSTHELVKFFDKRKRRALKELHLISKMKGMPLSELLGQMQLNLTAKQVEEAKNG